MYLHLVISICNLALSTALRAVVLSVSRLSRLSDKTKTTTLRRTYLRWCAAL
jgi:hypothetical protein